MPRRSVDFENDPVIVVIPDGNDGDLDDWLASLPRDGAPIELAASAAELIAEDRRDAGSDLVIQEGASHQPTGTLSPRSPKGGTMSDSQTNRATPSQPTTIAEVLDGLEPMGDLSRFAIDDLTPEEEDEFFRILEEA